MVYSWNYYESTVRVKEYKIIWDIYNSQNTSKMKPKFYDISGIIVNFRWYCYWNIWSEAIILDSHGSTTIIFDMDL